MSKTGKPVAVVVADVLKEIRDQSAKPQPSETPVEDIAHPSIDPLIIEVEASTSASDQAVGGTAAVDPNSEQRTS